MRIRNHIFFITAILILFGLVVLNITEEATAVPLFEDKCYSPCSARFQYHLIEMGDTDIIETRIEEMGLALVEEDIYVVINEEDTTIADVSCKYTFYNENINQSDFEITFFFDGHSYRTNEITFDYNNHHYSIDVGHKYDTELHYVDISSYDSIKNPGITEIVRLHWIYFNIPPFTKDNIYVNYSVNVGYGDEDGLAGLRFNYLSYWTFSGNQSKSSRFTFKFPKDIEPAYYNVRNYVYYERDIDFKYEYKEYKESNFVEIVVNDTEFEMYLTLGRPIQYFYVCLISAIVGTVIFIIIVVLSYIFYRRQKRKKILESSPDFKCKVCKGPLSIAKGSNQGYCWICDEYRDDPFDQKDNNSEVIIAVIDKTKKRKEIKFIKGRRTTHEED